MLEGALDPRALEQPDLARLLAAAMSSKLKRLSMKSSYWAEPVLAPPGVTPGWV